LNPAVAWHRLAKAVGVDTLSRLGQQGQVIGASTLATQIEKFRHAPEGRTRSSGEKLRQMLSASLRAYRDGPATLPARRRIVIEYLNSLPLAATAGRGEVLGLGDGFAAWYDMDFAEANRLLMPIEHVTAWLFRVARNRITDLFRKKRPDRLEELDSDPDEEALGLDDLLPSPEDGPEALYARGVLLEELEWAVAELPEEQREVFIAHEVEGRSFKDMAAESGISVNTLLSRKRYAVLRLRESLQSFYDELMKG
jgi:RNA polymerase sigma factor (sigma-70 family)